MWLPGFAGKKNSCSRSHYDADHVVKFCTESTELSRDQYSDQCGRLTGWLIHQLTCARAGNYGGAVLQSTSPIAALHARQCCADDCRYTGSRRIAFTRNGNGASAPFLNLSNSTEALGVSNQEDIICKVHGMDFR